MSRTPTERLFAVVDDRGPAARAFVVKAHELAGRAHFGQFRRSGDPYITHAVAVAAMVAELGTDLMTITAALLHDVPEDTPYPMERIRSEFGDEVADLLTAFATLDRIETFDELPCVDPRVLTIKIVERLHNMQTIQHLQMSRQQRKADHTRRLVSPLARGMGLTSVADELDALATRTLAGSAGPAGPVARPVAELRTARTLLHAAARVLLPDRCRDRWLAEWDAELHVLPSRHHRLAFVRSLLLGLPALAVHARRTRYADHGDRS
jgi:(p)ppGpp synthase/HD superfamily hydrolase